MTSSLLPSWYDLTPPWPKGREPRNWVERLLKRRADEAEKMWRFEKLINIKKMKKGRYNYE